MRAFGSRYSAHHENTLKAADSLGETRIVARGSSDVESFIDEPDEDGRKVVPFRNATFQGTGPEIWGLPAANAQLDRSEFAQVLKDPLARHLMRITIVSHAYLGGGPGLKALGLEPRTYGLKGRCSTD